MRDKLLNVSSLLVTGSDFSRLLAHWRSVESGCGNDLSLGRRVPSSVNTPTASGRSDADVRIHLKFMRTSANI